MIIIGIDPGFSGGIASVSMSGKTVHAFLMPSFKVGKKTELDGPRIVAYLEKRKSAIEHIYIEKVGAMPGQGVVSMFRFGEGFGFLKGICAGLHLPHTLVHSTSWKKVMCRDLPKAKGVSILVAKRLWPNVDLLPTPRSKKPSDGLADALCIAEYGRRQLIGEKQ